MRIQILLSKPKWLEMNTYFTENFYLSIPGSFFFMYSPFFGRLNFIEVRYVFMYAVFLVTNSFHTLLFPRDLNNEINELFPPSNRDKINFLVNIFESI